MAASTSRRQFLLAAAALGAVTACSPPQQGGTPQPGSTPGGDGALTVYSNSVSDGRGEWLAEQAKAQNFTLQFVNLGGGDIANRLTAEKANPIADVVFGLNNVFFENLKTADVLEPYTPSWSGEVDQLGDGAQFWPIVREPIMLVYNTKKFPNGAGAPADWVDLWTNPAFAKRYEVPATLGGATTRMVLAGILSRYRDPAGELGISAQGWEAAKAFFAQGSPSEEGVDLYARMAEGKVDLGQMWLAGKASREKEYKITTAAVTPKVGVPMAVQHVAVVKGSKRAETAKKFVDWFGSGEFQAAWSKKFFTAPTNSKALAGADQDAIKQTDAFTAQDIDWTFVAENLSGWVEKIELDVLG